MAFTATTGFNLGEVTTLVSTLSSTKETALRTKFETAETDGLDNSASVLELQQAMNEWSFAVGLSSSMIKSMADTYKSTVQKMP